MNAEFDAAILGAGVVGATCFHVLAAAGLRVAMLDQDRVGSGATGRSGGILRVSHSDSRQMSMNLFGMKFFEKLCADSRGVLSISRVGFVHFGKFEQREELIAAHRSMDSNIIELGKDELSRKYQAWGINAHWALLERESGYIDALQTAKYLTVLGISNNGSLYEGIHVDGLILNESILIGVNTSIGPIRAKNVVIALGFGTFGFAQRAGILPHALRRQAIQVGYFKASRGLDDFSCFVDDTYGVYGRPSGRGDGCFYLGVSASSLPTEANSSVPDTLQNSRALERAKLLFPNIAVTECRGGLRHGDTYTTDELPLIGAYAGHPRGLFFAAGMSGGGVRLAPYAAHLIADHLTRG